MEATGEITYITKLFCIKTTGMHGKGWTCHTDTK